MVKMMLNELKTAILGLSVEEQNKLYKFLDKQISEHDKNVMAAVLTKDPPRHYGIFHATLVDVLQAHRGIRLADWRLIANTTPDALRKGFAAFGALQSSLEVLGLAQEVKRSGLSEEALCGLCYRLIITNLTDFLTDRAIPVSFKSVINLVADWQGYFDKHFPGYLENGLFWRVVLRSNQGVLNGAA